MSNGGSYDPHAIEPEIYEFWEKGGYFHAEPDPNRKPYVIDIPLPNVTGSLHLGHALNNTVQDVLIRYKRMCGYNAMWMPGTDHAGIATQAVVEKRLKEHENLTRHELGRDGLVERIWAWKEEYGGRILEQLRRIGCSCDWQRARFTLDDVCARAVYEVFFQWFKDGLIYRGTRLVNWDAALQTAVADDEIVHETVQGHLWHYRYPILREGEAPAEPRSGSAGASPSPTGASPSPTGVPARREPRPPPTGASSSLSGAVARAASDDAKLGEDYLVIATTRPETMLGDTAIAVHPDDERYKHLIGRRCLLPLMNRPIPIIADDILVKPEFGTGCVKVTPGHDPNDYDCGRRHEAEITRVVGRAMINILTPDGKINEEGRSQGGAREGEAPAEPRSGSAGASPSQVFDYVGLDRYEARQKVVADLEALGLMEKVEPYETEIGHSDRSKTPIEPMLSEQWFVKMADLCELAMEAVRDGRVQFFPERYAKTYLDWLGEKRDWCISRQLWWGHRIPVWTRRLDPSKQHEEFKAVLALTARYYSRRDRVWPIAYGLHTQRQITTSEESPTGYGGFDEPVQFMVCLKDPDERGITQELEDAGLDRDPDVLDTWFSSALWPFSTLGWPGDYGRPGGPQARGQAGEGEAPAEPCSGSAGASPSRTGASPSLSDLDYFYPTSTLVTAREIITLWVARMVMTGLYFMKRVPFQHVAIHPNIQDGTGRRMSKSAGNGVDPLDIIELFGTDAMRFTLVQMATETQDVRMPVKPVKLPDGRTINSSEKFELGRNFCNKLWQAATGFVIPNLQGGTAVSSAPRPLKADDLAIEDRWILSRLAGCIAEVNRRFERYQLNEVANALYAFFWSDFCDWYVELVKPRLYGDRGGHPAHHESHRQDARATRADGQATQSADVARQVLAWVLDQTLRLLHPITPFVTEALWKQLNEAAPQRGIHTICSVGPPSPTSDAATISPALIAATWPDGGAWRREADVERDMRALQDVIRALRDIRAHVNQIRAAGKQSSIRRLPRAVIRTDSETAARLRQRLAVIQRLGQCEALAIGPDAAKPPESACKVLAGIEVYVPLAGLADLDIERQRLGKERDEVCGHLKRLEAKLANDNFVNKAPAAVVERERSRLAELKQRLAAIEQNLAEVSG